MTLRLDPLGLGVMRQQSQMSNYNNYQPEPDYSYRQPISDRSYDSGYGEPETQWPGYGMGEPVQSSQTMDPRVPGTPPPPTESSLSSQTLEALNRFKPETTATDAYNDLIRQFPERQEPSFFDRIVAAGAGLGNRSMNIPGGTQAVEQSLYAPWYRDVAEWKEQVPAYQAAMTAENTANNIARQTFGQVVSSENQMDRNQINNDKYIRDAENTRIRNTAAMLTAQRYTFRRVGDSEYMVSPDASDMVYLGPSGILSDAEKLAMQGRNQLANTQQQGANQQANIASQGANQQDLALTRMPFKDGQGRIWRWNPRINDYEIDQTLPTNAQPLGQGAGGEAMAAQTIAQRNLALQQALDEDPDAAGIIIPPTTANGRWELRPPQPEDRSYMPLSGTPGVPFSGNQIDPIKQQKYNELREKFGLSPLAQPGVAPPPPPREAAPPAPPGVSNAPPSGASAAAPPPITPPRTGPMAAEDRTRADIRAKVAAGNASRDRPLELERMLADPNTPRQIRPLIIRELEGLRTPSPISKIRVRDLRTNEEFLGPPATDEQLAADGLQRVQ